MKFSQPVVVNDHAGYPVLELTLESGEVTVRLLRSGTDRVTVDGAAFTSAVAEVYS